MMTTLPCYKNNIIIIKKDDDEKEKERTYMEKKRERKYIEKRRKKGKEPQDECSSSRPLLRPSRPMAYTHYLCV